MCLYVVENKGKPRKKRTVYKVLRLNYTKPLGLRSVMHPYQWKPGTNKARGVFDKRPGHDYTASEDCEVIDGGVLHAYTSKKRAKEQSWEFRVVVKFTAKPEHFKAWGKYGEVVYTQLTLNKTEYKRALKEIKKKHKME